MGYTSPTPTLENFHTAIQSPPLKGAGASQCSASWWALFQEVPFLNVWGRSLTHSRLHVQIWSAWHHGQRPETKAQAYTEANIPLSMAEFLSEECLATSCGDFQPISTLSVSDVTHCLQNCILGLAKTNPRALGNWWLDPGGPAAKTRSMWHPLSPGSRGGKAGSSPSTSAPWGSDH